MKTSKQIAQEKYAKSDKGKIAIQRAIDKYHKTTKGKLARKRADTKWVKANPHKVVAKVARRRAIKLNATPNWANHKKINEIYDNVCGSDQVDHIYPLNSTWVCGLHVHENLQILSSIENSKKSNRYMSQYHGS